MTDAQSTDRRNQQPFTNDQAEPTPGGSLGVLSLSSTSGEQPDFDPATALIAAATAPDGSVEEIVLLRLLVLRRAHPDAVVRTHLERVEDEQVVVRAEVTLSTGASASAYATAEGGVASIERTEHRALGRALDVLGESVLVDVARQDADPLATSPATHAIPEEAEANRDAPTALPDLDDDDWDDEDDSDLPGVTEEPQPAPESESRTPEREIPPARFSSSPPRARATVRTEPDLVAPEPDRTTPPPPAVVDAVRRANLRRHAAGQSERESVVDDTTEESFEPDVPASFDTPAAPQRPAATSESDDSADEPPLENYSWTAFWRVARPLGLDKMKVEQILGGPITPLTPLQVREKLKAAGVDI